jgi:hypothetical protein
MPTTTPHALRYPSLSDPANGPLAVQQLAEDVGGWLVYPCTSTTRPAHKNGRMIYETDTHRLLLSANGAWRVQSIPTDAATNPGLTMSRTGLSVASGATTTVGSYTGVTIRGGSPLSVAANGTITINDAGRWSINVVAVSDTTVAGQATLTLVPPSGVPVAGGTLVDTRQRTTGYTNSGTLRQPISAVFPADAGSTFSVTVNQTTSNASAVSFTVYVSVFLT